VGAEKRGSARLGSCPVPWAVWCLAVRDPVAGAGNRLNHLGLSELAPQSANRDLDGLGEGVGVLVPDLFQEPLGAEHARRGAQEGLEHSELLDRELDPVAVPCDRAPEPVELDSAGPVDGAARCRFAACQCPDPEH
jgi:hypothetical protein